jgi:hypothetical protein
MKRLRLVGESLPLVGESLPLVGGPSYDIRTDTCTARTPMKMFMEESLAFEWLGGHTGRTRIQP